MIDVLLGLQWGDEGKGKIADYFTRHYDIVFRWQGGANAGHTIYIDGKPLALHHIPSGIFNPKAMNIIGNLCVVNPPSLMRELAGLKKAVPDAAKRLLIGERTSMLIPTHKLLDALEEYQKGKNKVGSTLQGITPCYRDLVGRVGLRMALIRESYFKKEYARLSGIHIATLRKTPFGRKLLRGLPALEKEFFASITQIKNKLQIVSAEHYLREALARGKHILAEGAQGTMLDLVYGSYPNVTSSHTVAGSMFVGGGVPPQSLGRVYGVFKAYVTKVGSGPFPTKLDNEIGERIRQEGREFGATTGRPRDCGWLDLVALKEACALDGVTNLVMTKADILSNFKEVKVAIGYKRGGKMVKTFPLSLAGIEPVYATFKGWNGDISKIKTYGKLPKPLRDYIAFIEKYVGVPVSHIATGPERSQLIVRK